jgi:precorrin-8X/cobalt-precorrin-8 methylmutase
VVAIGNAPTALFEVVSLFENYDIQPALIVGAPVGFVNAVESKQALMKTSLNYITTQGRKGGSTVTVAIINALLRLAGD